MARNRLAKGGGEGGRRIENGGVSIIADGNNRGGPAARRRDRGATSTRRGALARQNAHIAPATNTHGGAARGCGIARRSNNVGRE